MDEIAYWIYTKRAPCLMKYDMANKQSQPILPPKASSIIHTISDETTTPKSKMPKPSIFEDDMETGDVQQNMFFNTSNQKVKQPTVISTKSESSEESDFNIKKSSIKQKVKRMKIQKNGHTVLHKKKGLVASTPKATAAVRRSLRTSRKSFNESSHINSSYEVSNVNGKIDNILSNTNHHSTKYDKHKMLKHTVAEIKNHTNTYACSKEKAKITMNGQFEPLSDVSGFTASYIRSTKSALKNGIAVKKKQRRDPNWRLQKQNQMVMHVNEVAVTSRANPLNSSTDSAPNCLNLANTQTNVQSDKQDKVTTLKFTNTKNKSKNLKDHTPNGFSNNNLDVSLQSPNGRRYPSRHRISAKDEFPIFNFDSTLNSTFSSSPRRSRRKPNINNNEADIGTPTPIVTRSRSSKLVSSPEKTDLLVINNSTEQTSTDAAINVASLTNKKNTNVESPTKSTKLRRSRKRKNSALKGSLRERSGFSACFSDSDDDKPLKPLKFFC